MIHEVIVKQKTNVRSFDYSFEQKLERGQLVKVNFGGKTVLGIISTDKPSSSYKVKPIKKVLTKKPIISKSQFEFADLLSREYIAALSETIFSFVPKLADKYLQDFDYHNKALKRKKPFLASIDLGTIKDQLKDIGQIIRSAGQHLIILPEIFDCLRAKEFLDNRNVYIYNSKITQADKLGIFSKLLGGQDVTIVATRAGCLLPFTELRNTFMFDPANFAYQEDQEPRYNGEKAVYLMTKTYGGNLRYCQTSFDIFTYTGYKKGALSLDNRLNNPEFTIIKSKDILCENVMQRVIQNSKENHKTLLVVPDSDVLFCKKCKSILECQSCQSTRLDVSHNCKNCKLRVNLTCPKCKGNDFEQMKSGLAMIKDDLKDFKNVYVREEYKLSSHDPNEQFSTIVYCNSDYLLHSSMYGANIKLMLRIRRLLNFAPREIIIITQFEQSKFWKYLANSDQEVFFNNELIERKQNHLPPFTRLVKVKKITSNKSDDKIIEEIKRIFENIDTGNGIYFFVPIKSSSYIMLEQKLANLRSSKFYIDPIDLN